MRTTALLLIALTLTACTTIRDISESHEGGRFSVGQTATANVGEVVFDRFRYEAPPTVRVQSEIPAAAGRYALAAGTRLLARTVNDVRAYCTPIDSNFACFYDQDSNGDFDHYLVGNLGAVSAVNPLEPVAPYIVVDPPVARGFKSELIYLGRSGNDIKLLYRDFTDDLSSPSYEQNLQYTLAAKGPTEVRYRDARFNILEADTNSIRYEILSGFAQ